MAKNKIHIDQFLQASGIRSYVAMVVQGAGFDISSVHEEHQHEHHSPPKLWSLWIKPLAATSERLGISQEILLITSEYADFQVRTVEYARRQIEHENRLSSELCIVISSDTATGAKVEEMSHADTVHFVGISIDDLQSFPPNGSKSLIQELQSRHFTKNIYDISTALTSRLAFYGREQLLREIGHNLQTTSSHVGLFGLRKMGKTSVLLRTLEYLKNSRNITCAHIDVQRIDAIRQEAGFFLWSLGQQLFDSNRSLRALLPSLKLFGRFDIYSDTGKTDDAIFELFNHDLGAILSSLGEHQAVVFLIDEVEHLLPSTKNRWGDAFVRIWRLLRGISQMHPQKIAYFIAGTSPMCVENPKIDAQDNPAYNFFKKVYLGPFSQEESRKLLDDIGRKIGLDWEPDASMFVHDLVGGHPILLRSYGSRIHKTLSPRNKARAVTQEIARGCIEDVKLDVNSVLTQMIEVLEEEYPDDYMLLNMLAEGRISDFRDYAEAFPTGVAHIKGYGLVNRPTEATALDNRLLQTWMKKRNDRKRTLSTSHSQLPEIDGYTLDKRIGHSGGFADVYIASPTRDSISRVAVKVLRSGSISALTREVDALTSLKSSGVVKIIDHGKSVDGSVFLVMELLEGPSLGDFCSPDKRMPPPQAESLLRALLTTLESIHPNIAEVERIRNRPQITLEDLQDLHGARVGIVHRDIKPENIILVKGRGPVLIDFGISSRVEEPIRTRSATPGYLPQDGNFDKWEVDVDLFAVSVTVAQVSTGLRIAPDGDLGDICVATEGALRGHFRDVLLRELKGAKNERFPSATAMLKALSSGVR